MKLISRRKVLEYIADYHWNNRGIAMDWTEAIDDIFSEVEKMPTIESRQKGKWVDHYTDKKTGRTIYGGIWCSNCMDGHGDEMWQGEEIKEYNFCPNCGADMRGEE